MCYINGVKVSLEEYIRYKREQKMIKDLSAAKLFYQPVKRCFEYTEWPIIRVDGFGEWDAVPMEWGIIPARCRTRAEANEVRLMYPTYNAIGAEILQKKTFAAAARKNRCLVPSTGFYESMHVPKIGKKGQPLKAIDTVPFNISVKDEQVFYMAGVYSGWFDPDKDEWINTFTICTADAGHIMSQIHNAIDKKTGEPKRRQPTILTEELQEKWLSKKLTDAEIVELASYQFDNDRLQFHTVKKQFWLDENPDEEVHYDNVPEIV